MRALISSIVLLLAAPVLLAFSAKQARADGFENLLSSATPIRDRASLTTLFWSQDADCKASEDDVLRRQCAGVRRGRMQALSERTFSVQVGSDAVEVVTDSKTMSVNVKFRSCIWCGADGLLVVGQGERKMEGSGLQAAVLGRKEKIFKSSARYDHWLKKVLPRLRADFVLKLPTTGARFHEGGRDGFSVKVVGYRLYDPCHGFVLLASPGSSKAPVDSATCRGDSGVPVRQEGKVAAVVLPRRLSPAQIKESMHAVSQQMRACSDAYGISGKAIFKMVIGGDGSMETVAQSGDFKGTPTGSCLDRALAEVRFPKSKKRHTAITYPIVLR